MDEYFYSLAIKASEASAEVGLSNIDPRWIYSQWAHESTYFSSPLACSNNNLGGLCQTEPNDTPQPDGSQYYIKFASLEDYATYFGHYLKYFVDGGVDKATTLAEYITALKNSPSGMYFGDDLDVYINDCTEVYNETFQK